MFENTGLLCLKYRITLFKILDYRVWHTGVLRLKYCYGMLRYVMLCYAVLWSVMLLYAMLYDIILLYILIVLFPDACRRVLLLIKGACAPVTSWACIPSPGN